MRGRPRRATGRLRRDPGGGRAGRAAPEGGRAGGHGAVLRRSPHGPAAGRARRLPDGGAPGDGTHALRDLGLPLGPGPGAAAQGAAPGRAHGGGAHGYPRHVARGDRAPLGRRHSLLMNAITGARAAELTRNTSLDRVRHTMNGIVSYGSYIPYFRLDRKSIGEALGASAGKGTRAVASYDEDTTSMGVEAARAALRGAPRLAPAALYFATADPAYLDKTNATAIHAALDLDTSAMAYDMLGSIRSGAGVVRAAADASRPTLAVLSDIRTGLPGGGDERDGGDAAVAFYFASGDVAHPGLADAGG